MFRSEIHVLSCIPFPETYYQVNFFHIVLREPFADHKEQLAFVWHFTSPGISSLVSLLSDVFFCISSVDVYVFFMTISNFTYSVKIHLSKKWLKNPFKNILEESVDEKENKEI